MLRRSKAPLVLFAFLAMPFLANCSEDPVSPSDAPPGPSGLVFSSGTILVGLGETIQLSSFLKFDQSTPLDGFEEAEWESSDLSTVRVSPNGAILGVRFGTAVITVRYRGHEANITVEVVEAWVDDPPVRDGERG